MKISDLGEFGLIDRIRNLSFQETSSAPVGIGDDAAALKPSASQVMLVTTDLLLEDVHFDLSYTDFYSLGWKSAAVNLSDIAAMGGVPRFCLTGIGIPRKVSAGHVLDFYRGFNDLLRRYRTILIGGDTCSSRKGLFISVTAIGEARRVRIVTRSGARPGDRIFVTGTLGDAAAGMELLKKGGRGQGGKAKGRDAGRLIEKHLRPAPRIVEGKAFALSGCASAMIDVSDGLSSDLSHICEQSATGAEIMTDHIPISPALRNMSAKLSKGWLHYALDGGEDYELLFTVPPNRVRKLRSLRMPVTDVGKITAGKGLSLIDTAGRRSEIRPAGYNHFKKAGRPRTDSQP